MKNINKIKTIFITCAILLFTSCTDLEPIVLDGVLLEDAAEFYAVNDEDASSLLENAYWRLIGTYVNNTRRMNFDEVTTDAMLIPTRGSEWDDGGRWRIWHNHTFDPTSRDNRSFYSSSYNSINNANLVIGSSTATDAQINEARFIRAIVSYHIVDYWGQLAFREVGSPIGDLATIFPRAEAIDWVINELEEILPNLPSGGNGADPSLASKNAVHYYLALSYLNYGVYAGDAANPIFDNSNMDKVISHVDAIQGVSIASNYFDNFTPDNAETSPELIYTIKGNPLNSGNLAGWYRNPVGFQQANGGWNSMSTTEDFFNAFDDEDDARISYRDPSTYEAYNHDLGFLQGEQYTIPYSASDFDDLSDDDKNFLASRIFFTDYANQEGEIRNDEGGFLLHAGRSEGVKLNFTLEVGLITDAQAGLSEGVRGVKYTPDQSNYRRPQNDFVMARYAGALTMKAEAQARKGDLGGATATVQLLPNETTTTISAVDDILDLRARELWWECKRRNDMIRFGKFLEPRLLKPEVSNPRYLLMPIPTTALGGNPNLVQNPGF